MPIYEYKCSECGKEFSKLTFTVDTPADCPECKSENTKKIISTIASGTTGKSSGASCGNSGFT